MIWDTVSLRGPFNLFNPFTLKRSTSIFSFSLSPEIYHVSMENLAIDSMLRFNNRFLTTHSIIFFLNSWENLHYELEIERVNIILKSSALIMENLQIMVVFEEKC